MTLKKVLPFILITVVILGIFFGPFTSQEANAIKFKWYLPMFGFVDPTSIIPAATVQKITVELIFYLIWSPAKFIFSLASGAFNASIGFTISSSAFSDLTEGPVAIGWRISRDIVNLFLIFILLYIAIATILQVSGYGAKELLATLIIIAFLVNFSLVITKMIIDASNVLTMEFYNKLTSSGSLAETFTNAFAAPKIINVKSAIQESPPNLYVAMIISFLFGSVILVITAFIFSVFSILFLIRMVVLLILMIFAPLAFGAMILPSTKSHAKKWWDTLFSQALFAPAALFMLYLGAVIINSGIIQGSLGVSGNAGVLDMLVDASGENPNWENIVKFSLNFVIIAIILLASIVVAKQLGAMGADSVMKGLKKAGRKAQGYAGKISGRAAGLGAEKLLTSENVVARGIRRIPLVGRGLARVSALREKQLQAKEKGLEKSYGAYSTAGLEALKKSPLTTTRRRKVIERVLAKRGPKTTQERIIEMLKAEAKAEAKAEMEAEKPTSPPPSKPA